MFYSFLEHLQIRLFWYIISEFLICLNWKILLVFGAFTIGMCLKENYSDSPSNEYLRHYSASPSPSVYDVTRDGKYAFAFLVFVYLAASESLD